MTNLEGPQKRKKCVYPFIYKAKTYNHCTTDGRTDGKRWCATKVDEKREYIENEIGICDPDSKIHSQYKGITLFTLFKTS